MTGTELLTGQRPLAEDPAGARLCLLTLPASLEALFAWLNANLPVDPRYPLTRADVAHVSLMPHEFAEVPGETFWCEHRRITLRRAGGIEFWRSPLMLPELNALADLRGRFAWKLTRSTRALFRF
jgi:hypothetical protein